MFPLLVKLEKMNLQMEFISDKYNIYTNYQKNNWNPLSYFEKWWEIKVLKNDCQRFSACHLKLLQQTMYFIFSYSLVDICQKGLTAKLWMIIKLISVLEFAW